MLTFEPEALQHARSETDESVERVDAFSGMDPWAVTPFGAAFIQSVPLWPQRAGRPDGSPTMAAFTFFMKVLFPAMWKDPSQPVSSPP